jgi:hypothetical protein
MQQEVEERQSRMVRAERDGKADVLKAAGLDVPIARDAVKLLGGERQACLAAGPRSTAGASKERREL